MRLLTVLSVLAVMSLSGVGMTVAEAHRPLALGFNSSEVPEQMGRAIDDFTAQTGAKPVLAMYYQDFYEGWSTALINRAFVDQATARGVLPLITWDPAIADRQTMNQPDYALKTIADGEHDAYLRRAAREVRALGTPVLIRFAHEMNGDWSSWDRGYPENTPADYVAAWRHVVSVFRDEGATSARWVWSPNVYGDNGVAPFAPYYPGDAWVDWVALDGYNWGATPGHTPRTLAQVFQSSYDALTTLTNKPVMIAETSSAESGGDKAEWIRQGLLQTVPNAMPNVRAVVWFDRVKETDWRVTSSPSSAAAFRAVVDSALYDGTAWDLLNGVTDPGVTDPLTGALPVGPPGGTGAPSGSGSPQAGASDPDATTLPRLASRSVIVRAGIARVGLRCSGGCRAIVRLRNTTGSRLWAKRTVKISRTHATVALRLSKRGWRALAHRGRRSALLELAPVSGGHTTKSRVTLTRRR